jgi:hypothetical protein
VNPKSRWLLGTVAVGVVAVGIGFVFFREAPKDDLPRLVVLSKETTNGQRVVVFRFDVPKHKKSLWGKTRTQNPSTGMERDVVWSTARQFWGANAFGVTPPVDDVWRLRCEVALEDTGIKGVLARVQGCWREKSFAPLRRDPFIPSGRVEVLESDLITNAVPRAP